METSRGARRRVPAFCGVTNQGTYARTGPARLNEGPVVRLQIVVLGLAGWPRARASHWLAPEGSRALMSKVLCWGSAGAQQVDLSAFIIECGK